MELDVVGLLETDLHVGGSCFLWDTVLITYFLEDCIWTSWSVCRTLLFQFNSNFFFLPQQFATHCRRNGLCIDFFFDNDVLSWSFSIRSMLTLAPGRTRIPGVPPSCRRYISQFMYLPVLTSFWTLKFPIISTKHHQLPSPRGELAPAIEAVLDVYGTEVLVVVSHNGQGQMHGLRNPSLFLILRRGRSAR